VYAFKRITTSIRGSVLSGLMSEIGGHRSDYRRYSFRSIDRNVVGGVDSEVVRQVGEYRSDW
jgi:hypothetical protein